VDQVGHVQDAVPGPQQRRQIVYPGLHLLFRQPGAGRDNDDATIPNANATATMATRLFVSILGLLVCIVRSISSTLTNMINPRMILGKAKRRMRFNVRSHASNYRP
jgi:hypothetical protein